MRAINRLSLLLAVISISGFAQVSARYDTVARQIMRTALVQNKAIEMLRDLCAPGPRLSGSPQAKKAVQWSKASMERLGFERVRL